MPSARDLLLDSLDRSYGTRAWHGTTLRGALRGLKPEDALWRPAPARHNVWELLLHAGYWKYIVRRHVAADFTLRYPRRPSDWPALPEPADASALKADIAVLAEQHEGLRAAVAKLPLKRLDDHAGNSAWTLAQLVQGAVAHDLYHTGQIQLLKRLRKGV